MVQEICGRSVRNNAILAVAILLTLPMVLSSSSSSLFEEVGPSPLGASPPWGMQKRIAKAAAREFTTNGIGRNECCVAATQEYAWARCRLACNLRMRIQPPRMVLRGGEEKEAADAVAADGEEGDGDGWGDGEWGTSDEEIVGEGTGNVKEGANVQESIMQKLKKASNLTKRGMESDFEQDMWAQMGLDDDPILADPFGTLEDMRADREQWYRENPGAEVKVNETLLFEVRCENLTEALEMLRLGADVNYVDEEGDTALHIAAITNNVTMIDALVSAGASLEIGNNESNTPLHYAAEHGSVAAVRALVGHGANISVRNEVMSTPLMTAAILGHHDLIDVMVELGADPNVCSLKGSSVVHHAAGWGHVEVLKALVRNGADPNATTPFGRTPMDWASYSNNTAAMRYLKSLGVPRVTNAMLPALEIKKWAEEKRADAEERRAARRSEGGSVPAGPSAAKKGRSGSPLIITRMAASHMGAAEGRWLGLGPDSDEEDEAKEQGSEEEEEREEKEEKEEGEK